MHYLHQSDVEIHGRLKSSNILLDGRWTCKVTDIGMWKFRAGESNIEKEDPVYHYRM